MEMAKINNRLSSLMEQLESIVKNIGPDFLNLSQMLEHTHSEAKTITRLTLKALQTGGDETDQSPLNNVADFSEDFLRQLENDSAELFGNLEDIKTSIDYLDRLQKVVYSIRSIAKTLNMISINVAIESSRSNRCEEIFGLFVDEIKELSNRVNMISKDICNDSKSSQTKQLEILNDIIARTYQLKKITAKANEIIKTNVDGIKHFFSVSQDGLKKSRDYSKEISRHIGIIIESIQFEDITRQQLEHIFHAIKDAEEQYTRSFSREDDQALDTEILSQVHSTLVIQMAQIEQVISEIRDVHNRILNSFIEISKLVDMLVEETTGFSLGKNTRNETGIPFEELISGFTNLDEILKQGYTLSEKIEEAVTESVEITSNLSSHVGRVEDISLDLHIKAINAILMSERLGNEGLPHAVLARNVTEVSKESNNFIAEIVDIIGNISNLTENLNKTSGEGAQRSKTLKEDNRYSLESNLGRISDVYKQFKETSSLAFEHSGILKKSVSQSDSALYFLQDIADRLSECIENTRPVIQSLDPYKRQIPADENEINQISQKYTMKIERDIHNRAINHGDQPPWTPDEPVDDEGSEFGENVELF